MATKSKTKTADPLSPLTAKLQAKRDAILTMMDETAKEIEAAILDSGTQVLGEHGTRVPSSSIARVVAGRAKLDLLQAGLTRLEAKIAAAPATSGALQAALTPLSGAIQARNVVQAEAESLLSALYDKLFELRASNQTAQDCLRVALKAWVKAGKIPTERPSWPSLQWDPVLHRKYAYTLPFAAPWNLRGDMSNALLRLLPDADPDGSYADPDSGEPSAF